MFVNVVDVDAESHSQSHDLRCFGEIEEAIAWALLSVARLLQNLELTPVFLKCSECLHLKFT